VEETVFVEPEEEKHSSTFEPMPVSEGNAPIIIEEEDLVDSSNHETATIVPDFEIETITNETIIPTPVVPEGKGDPIIIEENIIVDDSLDVETIIEEHQDEDI